MLGEALLPPLQRVIMGKDDYGQRLLTAYTICFPQAQVSVQTTTAPAENVWTGTEAATSARINLSTPTLDEALGRSQKRSTGLCVPHILADVSQDGDLRLTSALKQAIKSGKKLTALQKAELAQLADKPLRVALTAAYAINRCLLQDYTYACIPVFLRLDNGEGHANLLILELKHRRIVVQLYEPNGIAASEKYGTVERLFPSFERDVGRYLKETRSVKLRVVGAGLQTVLGETSEMHRGMRTITRSRGYPVCEAIVLFVIAEFMKQSQVADVEKFEQRLIDDRASTRQALLKFVENLAEWVQRSYAEALSTRLRAIFQASNVLGCEAIYGSVEVSMDF